MQSVEPIEKDMAPVNETEYFGVPQTSRRNFFVLRGFSRAQKVRSLLLY
jgi:hypothetical protein